MVVNVHILYLFSHCVSFALLIIDFIVILHVRLIRVLLKINQSINQSKPQSNGPLYSNTVIGALAVDEWAVIFGTTRRGLGWLRSRPVPSLLYQV